MINDLTAVPEVGKTYLGKVVRIAEFGAFVEIIPGTDGLLHISEIAEHRVREVSDELKEGDQVLVKVLGIEGNRIKLSRKAILKEQRAKMAQAARVEGDGAPAAESGEAAHHHRDEAHSGSQSEETITFEGGGEFPNEENEPNFNREEANRETVGASRPSHPPHGGRPHGGGGGGRRHGGGGGGRRHGRGPRGDRGPRDGGNR
jgi:polyribonucleotide nucleotidyltransferase